MLELDEESSVQAQSLDDADEDKAEDVQDYRTISLLDVEGKLFFAIKADRMLEFALQNGYINTSIQKGGIKGGGIYLCNFSVSIFNF